MRSAAWPPTLAKNARMGHPRSDMGKEEQSVEEGGPPAYDHSSRLAVIVAGSSTPMTISAANNGTCPTGISGGLSFGGSADGGWATLTEKYNAGLSFNIDRNNWGCATSRAFREVACRAGDTVRLRFTRVPHVSRFSRACHERSRRVGCRGRSHFCNPTPDLFHHKSSVSRITDFQAAVRDN